MIHLNGNEPAQGVLFTEDQMRSELEKLESQIRHHSEEVRSKFKRCEGFLSLLKNGPKSVADILFRCQQNDLAERNTDFLAAQALELSEILQQSASTIRLMNVWQEEAITLRGNLGLEGGKNEEDAGNDFDPDASETEPDDSDIGNDHRPI